VMLGTLTTPVKLVYMFRALALLVAMMAWQRELVVPESGGIHRRQILPVYAVVRLPSVDS